MFSFLKYSNISEAVSVKKQNYSWGKMITVHHGSDTSYPLHPEHQAKIKSLKDGEKTSFKDETKRTVTAHREGDKVHLSGAGSSKKTTVAHSHFAEEVEIDELSQMTLSKYAAKARAQSMDKNNPKRYKRGSGAAQAYDKLNRGDYSEEVNDINFHRAELKKTSDKIDSIVKGGGKVGLNDPLSKKLKLHSAQIKKLKEEINQMDEESLTAGKRLISKHGEGSHTARVYKDTEYNEYQVHHYKDGKHMGEGPISYHNDKEDAENTAKMHLKKLKEATSAYGRIDARFKKLSGRSMGAAAKEYGDEAKRLQKEIDAQKAENERRQAAMKKEEVSMHPDVKFQRDMADKEKAKLDALKAYDLRKKYEKMREDVEVYETKSAPKGFHFTRDGKLKRGDADVDGDGGKKLRSDPLDKTRNKIPAVSEENINEATPSSQQVKQAIGIARDKRYAKGNVSGAVKAMNKLNPGLAQHPVVKKELQKQNEEKDDLPFTPDKPKNPSAKAGKYGLGYSTAKHLAQMALAQQTKKKQDKSS